MRGGAKPRVDAGGLARCDAPMAKVFLLLMVLACAAVSSVAAPREAYAQGSPQARSVSRALLDFEGAVSWASVSPAWRTQRPVWLRAVRTATTPQEFAVEVVALEAAMGWPAVQESWRQERPQWLAQMHAATTDAEVARGLLRLEAVTKWEAMSAAWRRRRARWVAALRVIAGG